ncbi:hypothetical protein M5G27_30705 [Pseudomonas shahriarae]|uniref:Uncharacterized protein n=1 Tax=Pseudomonas shahriarae TaxID=2745512 RepID=A0A9X4C7Y2_9PSED|nr:hypothetical protein [Pseudomonas shahriarae]MDD1011817.1 hypothetical protein [Pseudomonas shahriarae]
MPEQKPIIMYDAPEAASLKTLTGWVSADGRFFGGDENLARYCGATHRRCEVNPEHPIYEVNSSCDECRHARRQAKFAAMPIKEWPANHWSSSMGTGTSSMKTVCATT